MRYLRDTAVRLLEIAAEMEKPVTDPTTRAGRCTCDRCGDSVVGQRWVGERCQATTLLHVDDPFRAVPYPCIGHYRLDPGDLPLDRMAFEAAMMTFLADDPDNDDTADWPDIASTYRGRSR